MSQQQWFLGLGFIFLFSGCAHQASLVTPAPSELPGVVRPMKTAGFWISRHPFPDKVILTGKEIVEFNAVIRDKLRLTTDISQYDETESGKALKAELESHFQLFAGKKFYLASGGIVRPDFLAGIRRNMAGDTIPAAVAVRFGFIIHYADQRILPTEKALLAEPGDVDFDELQNNALDVGTPVVILQESRDRQWCFCRAEASSGWVKKDLIAFSSRAEVADWPKREPFVVVVSAKADIYLDEELRRHYDYAQMGTRFAFNGRVRPGVVRISFPVGKADGTMVISDGYLKKDDVAEDYLPYTPRNIIEQAFKLLNAPYGWGGMFGEQDCSRFVQEVFATVGIRLARNSGDQVKSGIVRANFDGTSSLPDKEKIFRTQTVAGITLLGMKGHIMLYLGTVDNRSYAIHSTWAFRENSGGQEVKHVIGKVTVSDLSLGEHSSRGSLLKRLKTVVQVSSKNYPFQNGRGLNGL